ncbi:MAG: sugar ABC transporter permease [Clostridia bacterium]|nr:sugar ABC transporter permease [Clostridia bacterium]
MLNRKNRLSYRRSWMLNSLVFLAPWVIGFLLFFATPLWNTIWYSFNTLGVGSDGKMTAEFVGIQNYVSLFTDVLTKDNTPVTRLLVEENLNILMNAPVILVFSLFLAIILNSNFKGRAAVRIIFFLPIILGLDIVKDMLTASSGDFVDVAAESFFGEDSPILQFLLVNTFLPEGVVNFLGEINNNIYNVISGCGVQTLIFLAGLQSINGSLYEVAKIEGATTYEIFWKITLPMLKDIMTFVLVYSFIDLFLASSIADEIYTFAFMKNSIGIGSALSVVYMINVLLDLVLMLFVFNKVVNLAGETKR